ncbi:MAG: RecX family transcriptional regulator [Phycisphaerae bacterium]|mgnify:CR=1 FL=1|nr:RecX family transcriptional regulator [Phycisphaerae bacterium]
MATRSSPSSTIDSIAPLRRDPSLVAIVVGGTKFGTALRSEVEGLGLREGGTLSQAKRKILLRAIDTARARTVALKSLARSDHSRTMLERILVDRHECDARIAAATLDELTSDGWLDDQRYATERARTLADERACSSAFIVESLVNDGVDERVAERTAHAAAPPAQDEQRALAAARAALRGERVTRASAPKLARRIAGVLARRGFDADTITASLEQLGLQPTQ